MSFQIVNGDITKMETDAIVNAANSNLLRGGGVCGAIFSVAGSPKLQEECHRLAPCSTGCAVITGGYNLPAKYIIHAVGPVWSGGENNEEKLLEAAYTNSLKLALENGCESIAFPLISSGIYGYPREDALYVAMKAISEFLEDHNMDVYLVMYK